MKKTLNIIQLIVSGVVAILMFISGMFEYERWEVVYAGYSKKKWGTPFSLFDILVNSNDTILKIFAFMFILALLVSIIGIVIAICTENNVIARVLTENKFTTAISCCMLLFMFGIHFIQLIIPVDYGAEYYYRYDPTFLYWLVLILLVAIVVIDFYKRTSRVKNAPVTIKTNVVQANSNADELKKYKDLLDSGVITQEEFEAKKKQLLGL